MVPIWRNDDDSYWLLCCLWRNCDGFDRAGGVVRLEEKHVHVTVSCRPSYEVEVVD
nr:hypothetical protein Itr_chr10CG05100 [Ipomoea trifida]